jgi:hypothetical protein
LPLPKVRRATEPLELVEGLAVREEVARLEQDQVAVARVVDLEADRVARVLVVVVPAEVVSVLRVPALADQEADQEADRVALVPVVEDPAVQDRAGGDQEAARVRVVVPAEVVSELRGPAVADQVAERQGWARGLELEAAVAQRLFPEWWPALRAVGPAVEASRRKRNSLGFSVR